MILQVGQDQYGGCDTTAVGRVSETPPGDVTDEHAPTDEHWVRQEAEKRLVAAMSQMFCADALLDSDSRSSSATNSDRMRSSLLESIKQPHPPTPSPSARRMWTAQQVHHIRQSTNAKLERLEGRLQCCIECLQESSPCPIIIGAFLTSCQV